MTLDLSRWPYSDDESRNAAVDRSLERCETLGQTQSALGAMLWLDMITEILMTPPRPRRRWWWSQ